MSYSDLTVATDDVIEATWGNKVRDRTINPLANDAARAAAITAPAEGMQEWMADANRMVIYDGAAWVHEPGQVLARYRRTTNSSTTTSEVGVTRIDDVAVPAGQALRVWTPPLSATSATSDVVAVRVRYTTDGSTPTTSSSILPGAECTRGITNTSYEESISVEAIYIPASAQTLSLLLTVARLTGAGASGILSGADNPIDLVIETCGTDPGSSGTSI